MLKINVDAALFRDANSFSYVVVVRNHCGDFVEALTICRLGIVSPELA